MITEAKKHQLLLLGKGNSAEEIRKNEELFDYSNVRLQDLQNAKRWFKAQKPKRNQSHPELVAAYHQYRVWNVPECSAKYKGHLVKLKATGESAYSPPTEEAGPMWHRKDEGEESEGEESEGEDVGAAMAAVKLE